MLFSIIYSCEFPPEVPVSWVRPPDFKRNGWEMTECHFSEVDESEGKPAPERWKHRKYCALLNKAQFNEFVDMTGLHAEDVQTMGSLGAPGFGIGWAPAISFNMYNGEWYADAYVTPIPEVECDCLDERNWERVRRVVIGVYGG